MSQKFDPILTRRKFLHSVSTVGAGLTLAINLPNALADEKSVKALKEAVFSPNAFVRVTPANKVIVILKHLEKGQGVATGLSTLVAEELDADWESVETEFAPAENALYKNLHWGIQGTGGSSAIANSFMQMRYAGAAAKKMLLMAAAEQWNVPVSELKASNSVISHAASKKSATYGEMSVHAENIDTPAEGDLTLKSPEQFQLIGKHIPRKDTGKTDGTAIFTQDIELPNMQVAVVAHAPKFGAQLKSFDAKESLKVPGVFICFRDTKRCCCIS